MPQIQRGASGDSEGGGSGDVVGDAALAGPLGR